MPRLEPVDFDPFAGVPPSTNVQNRVGEPPEQMNQEIGQGMMDDFRAMKNRPDPTGPAMPPLVNFDMGLSDIAQQHQQMTHQPEQPNPAAPYLTAAGRFATHGVSGAAGQEPGWMDYIAHGLSSGSLTAPLAGGLGAIRLIPKYVQGPGGRLDPTGGRYARRFYMQPDDPLEEPLGNLTIDPDPANPKKAYVGWAGTPEPTTLPDASKAAQLNEGAWTLGKTRAEAMANARSLRQAIKDEFPEAEFTEGSAASGVHSSPGASGMRGGPKYGKLAPTTTFEKLYGSRLPRGSPEQIRQFPAFSDFERDLFDISQQGIAETRASEAAKAAAGRAAAQRAYEEARARGPAPPLPQHFYGMSATRARDLNIQDLSSGRITQEEYVRNNAAIDAAFRRGTTLQPPSDPMAYMPRAGTMYGQAAPAEGSARGSERWSNPEMHNVAQSPHGMWDVTNREGVIMAQGATRQEAIDHARQLGAEYPQFDEIFRRLLRGG